MPERAVLLVTLEEMAPGHDLVVLAEPDVFEEAQGLEPMTRVHLSLVIAETLYRGSSARHRAVRLKVLDE